MKSILILSVILFSSLAFAGETSSRPGSPSNLKAAVSGAHFVQLTWNDNTTNESGFIIERSRDGEEFEEIERLVGNHEGSEMSFVDQNLQDNTNYFYRVAVYGPGGEISHSEVFQTITPQDHYALGGRVVDSTDFTGVAGATVFAEAYRYGGECELPVPYMRTTAFKFYVEDHVVARDLLVSLSVDVRFATQLKLRLIYPDKTSVVLIDKNLSYFQYATYSLPDWDGKKLTGLWSLVVEKGDNAILKSVHLQNSSKVLRSTITDENGYYRFPRIPSGDYKVRVRAAEYFFGTEEKTPRLIKNLMHVNFQGQRLEPLR